MQTSVQSSVPCRATCLACLVGWPASWLAGYQKATWTRPWRGAPEEFRVLKRSNAQEPCEQAALQVVFRPHKLVAKHLSAAGTFLIRRQAAAKTIFMPLPNKARQADGSSPHTYLLTSASMPAGGRNLAPLRCIHPAAAGSDDISCTCCRGAAGSKMGSVRSVSRSTSLPPRTPPNHRSCSKNCLHGAPTSSLAKCRRREQ
jgi:hypothetical protein